MIIEYDMMSWITKKNQGYFPQLHYNGVHNFSLPSSWNMVCGNYCLLY